MKPDDEVDLRSSLEISFPGLSLAGNLFHQWPVGLRFNIGLSEIDRAVLIFNAILRHARDRDFRCVQLKAGVLTKCSRE
jgi:hypothetical protein